jgi:mRNA interferase HigB
MPKARMQPTEEQVQRWSASTSFRAAAAGLSSPDSNGLLLAPVFSSCSHFGSAIPCRKGVIGTLREFWRKHPDAEIPLRAWYAEAVAAQWRSPADVKVSHRSASFIAGNRVVFNIKGNVYRLVVAVHYNRGLMFVRLVGTHRDYDRIDATTI